MMGSPRSRVRTSRELDTDAAAKLDLESWHVGGPCAERLGDARSAEEPCTC
jgi:hypothetical protein